MKEQKQEIKTMELSQDVRKELERTGDGIRSQLNAYYQEWSGGLPFKVIFSKYGTRAKNLGMDIGNFAQSIQDLGFIKIRQTPSGKRTVFSIDCPMSDEEITAHIQEQELIEQGQKEAKKLNK